MLITLNNKILKFKPKVEVKNKPPVSPWFKKWLIVIVFLYLLFFTPIFLLKNYQDLAIACLIIIFFGLIISTLIISIKTIINLIKDFLKFKLVIYY